MHKSKLSEYTYTLNKTCNVEVMATLARKRKNETD